jgi:hypothetical protein
VTAGVHNKRRLLGMRDIVTLALQAAEGVAFLHEQVGPAWYLHCSLPAGKGHLKQ